MKKKHNLEDIPECKEGNVTVNGHLNDGEKHNLEDLPEYKEDNDTVNGHLNCRKKHEYMIYRGAEKEMTL